MLSGRFCEIAARAPASFVAPRQRPPAFFFLNQRRVLLCLKGQGSYAGAPAGSRSAVGRRQERWPRARLRSQAVWPPTSRESPTREAPCTCPQGPLQGRACTHTARARGATCHRTHALGEPFPRPPQPGPRAPSPRSPAPLQPWPRPCTGHRSKLCFSVAVRLDRVALKRFGEWNFTSLQMTQKPDNVGVVT